MNRNAGTSRAPGIGGTQCSLMRQVGYVRNGTHPAHLQHVKENWRTHQSGFRGARFGFV